MEDVLVIGFDCNQDERDFPCLIVTRRNNDETYIVNQFTKEKALRIYNELINTKE